MQDQDTQQEERGGMPCAVRLMWGLALAFCLFWLLTGLAAFFGLANTHRSTRPGVARVQSDLRTYATALETYYIDYSTYPPTANLHVLTTPIAYLSRLQPDYFSVDRHEGKLDWIIPSWMRKKQPDPLPIEYFSSGTQYLVYSRGPDKRFDIMPKRDFSLGMSGLEVMSYDPTNGALSSGDVWRFGGKP